MLHGSALELPVSQSLVQKIQISRTISSTRLVKCSHPCCILPTSSRWSFFTSRLASQIWTVFMLKNDPRITLFYMYIGEKDCLQPGLHFRCKNNSKIKIFTYLLYWWESQMVKSHPQVSRWNLQKLCQNWSLWSTWMTHGKTTPIQGNTTIDCYTGCKYITN